MSAAKRHHFLPVFFLKQFTLPQGNFYVFDVKKRQFKNHGKLFFPATQFYEHHGNTVFLGTEPSQFIEDSFSNYDSKVAEIIRKVTDSSNWQLQSDEWTMLQYFVNIVHWRIPSNKLKVLDYIDKSASLSDFRLKLFDSRTKGQVEIDQELELLKKMKADPDFHKYVKLILPAITYPEIFTKEVQDNATIQDLPFELPKLISDNPIIYRKGTKSLHTDEFVFPLTPTKLLIRHKAKKIRVWSWVKILVDMLTLVQADCYVAVTDVNYPGMLLDTFEKDFKSTEVLRNEIFKGIIDIDQV